MRQKRKIIKIDREKCNGCGVCVSSCAEGAIQLVDGKAQLVSESYCDGLGACLGECPVGAITMEEREADAFAAELPKPMLGCGCPGSAMRSFAKKIAAPEVSVTESALGHWPVQLSLVPENAPFLQGADLLICADCVPFALPDFHSRYLQGRGVVVGCPKLDDLGFYQEKLEGIFERSAPRSITVLRMEVPCCSGIARAALEARNKVIPQMPFEVHTIGIQGNIQKN